MAYESKKFFLKQILEMAKRRKGHTISDIDNQWESLDKLKNLINNMVQNRIQTQDICHCNVRTSSCDCFNRSSTVSTCLCNLRTVGCECQGRIMVCPSHSPTPYSNTSISLKELQDKVKSLRGQTLNNYPYPGCSCQNRTGDPICTCQTRTGTCNCVSRTPSADICICNIYACVCVSRTSVPGQWGEHCYEYAPRYKDWPNNSANSNQRWDSSWTVSGQYIYDVCQCKARTTHQHACHCNYRTGLCHAVSTCPSDNINVPGSTYCQCNCYQWPSGPHCECQYRVSGCREQERCTCNMRSPCSKDLKFPGTASQICSVSPSATCTNRSYDGAPSCPSFMPTGTGIGGSDDEASSMCNTVSNNSPRCDCQSRTPTTPVCNCNLQNPCDCVSRTYTDPHICNTRCGCNVVSTYDTIIND